MMVPLNLTPEFANGAKNLRMVPDDAGGMTVKGSEGMAGLDPGRPITLLT